MRYVVEVEFELPTEYDELSTEGWDIISQFQEVVYELKRDYGWQSIEHVGNPKRKNN